MTKELLHDPYCTLSSSQIEELQKLCYEYGNSMCPFDSFFNDIRDNPDEGYNRNAAFKDLWLILLEFIDAEQKANEVRDFEKSHCISFSTFLRLYNTSYIYARVGYGFESDIVSLTIDCITPWYITFKKNKYELTMLNFKTYPYGSVWAFTKEELE